MENADILDSRIKKVRIELPHYSFSHSSSGESSNAFLGRKKIKDKLKKIVEATTDETGVYLVTGNRGVGKTSLVSQVITETSLQPNSNFSKNLKYLFVLLFSVVLTQFCLQEFTDNTSFWKVCICACAIVCALGSFFILGWFSYYRRKIHKQNISFLEILKEISMSAAKELLTSINSYNPYNQYNQYQLAQYILKIILVVSLTQFLSVISCVTPTIVFIGYSGLVIVCMFILFVIYKKRQYCHKYKKGELSKCNIIKEILLNPVRKYIINPIRKYIKNHRRLYLRINFGHKLKDEKDILRLIARTLNTEYHEYLRSFKQMLPWWIIALCFLLLFAYLFSTIVEKQEFYKSIKESKLYRTSSQIYLNDLVHLEVKDSTYLKVKDSVYIKKDSVYVKRDFAHTKKDSIHIKEDSLLYIKKDSIYLKAKDFFGIEKDKKRLENAFVNDSCYKKDKEHLECIFTNDNDYNKRLMCVFINDNCPFNKAETFLLALDQLVFEISKRAKKIPQFFLREGEKIDFDKKFIPPVNYLFGLSFFLMYLLCVLLFRCNWIKYFFVTHRIIKQQLERLNSDITHSTELEKSVNINGGGIGTKIGTKTKKSRGIADAREIEKELQDILYEMQRIPFFMCRPSVVIVFDELDKVEPGESNLEDKNQKTKASLFSIDTTRERQTEILKILSNMKYFLSTVKAKFIFIAGREMYDIYLADVSERNNYIGSIFNAVIHVPSFLTDYSDGTHADMTSLTEEFVCRRLIPRDYRVESHNLKEYKKYLKKEIYNDAKIEEIEQKIRKIIDGQNEEIKQKKITIINEEIKRKIQEVIDEQNEEEKKKKIAVLNKEIEQKIQEVIDEQNEKIKKKIVDILNEEIKQIIVEQNKKIEQKIIVTLNKIVQQIQKIIAEQSEEIKQKKIAVLNEEIKRKIQEIINEQNEKIEQKIIAILNKEIEQKIHKIIAILQQFIIYLAHVSKGAVKEMMQLFESSIEVCEINKKEEDEFLVVQRYHNSKLFLTFNYYKQYMLGVFAYLITPIFNRLSISEGNIRERSDNDKLLVSSLRFIDFLFKFHKHPFSWKHLDISPEMLEVNRSLELKSVAVDLLNYLAQIHVNKSNFSLSDYKFDNLISDEIFAVTKIDEVFSALFSFSLDETLSLKKHYQDMLQRTQKEYINDKNSPRFIDAVSSLQVVLGDLHYYDDELEEAGVYYKNAVQELSNLKPKKDDVEGKNDGKEGKKDEAMTLEQHYLYVRNMLRLGMIYENRKQYDFAYLTYGELCKQIIRERNITIKELSAGLALREDSDEIVFVKTSTTGKIDKEEKKYYDNVEFHIKSKGVAVDASTASPRPLYFKNISPNTNDVLSKKMTYEGLKMLYLPFIAKLQILEKSHVGGITRNHLEQLEKEFKFLTFVIDHEEANLLEAEFYSRLADILYYKNSDLKSKKKKNRKEDNDEDKNREEDKSKLSDEDKDIKNYSCTACHYYHKALSILLDLDKIKDKNKNTVTELLSASVERINANYNMKYCTILARILSDWGNVFFSCDYKHTKYEQDRHKCYICDAKDCNTRRTCYRCACYICDINNCNTNNLGTSLKKYIDYVESESKEENRQTLRDAFKKDNLSKMEIAFAMYAISLKAYAKSNLYKRSAYQIFKMLRLFKYYKIYEYTEEDYTKKLSKKAIRSLWHANEELNILELNKRKKDFDKHTIEEKIPLQYILVDSEINRVRVLVKDLELRLSKTKNKATKKFAEKLNEYYSLYITSPYGINYSIPARIYQLRLKATVNYETYQMLIYDKDYEDIRKKFWDENDKDDKRKLETGIKFILNEERCNETVKLVFKEYLKNDNVDKKMRIDILERLISETIFCFKEIIRLSKTIGETYLFNHIFMGSIHEKLAFWIRLYEIYEKKYKKKNESHIDEYFKKYLGEEWEEQLSGYYETQQALSHYYKCLETHNEGKAYHNMIDNMCYLKDDYNDRSDHFNIAEERHNILNEEIRRKIERLKELYKDSELYKVGNYYEH